MGSSAKSGKNFFDGSQEQFLDKTVIWDRTPPPICQMQYICVGEGSRVPNLQTEFNYLNSFKSYGIFSDFVVPTHVVPTHVVPVIPIVPTSSPSSPHHPPRHLEGPQIIPNPPDSHPIYSPPPLGGGGPRITKNTIRFELIEIF